MRLLIVVIFIVLLEPVLAQKQRISSALEAGKLLSIYPGYPSSTTNFGVDLSWTRQGDTTNVWEQAWNFPETGVLVAYNYFGNSDTLGYSLGVMYRFILRQHLSKRWILSEGMDLGFSWYNKPFQATENSGNIAVGSQFTAVIRLSISLNYLLAPQWELFSGFTFHHASNGHTGLPNVGINIPMIHLGTRYALTQDDSYCLRSKTPIDFHRTIEPEVKFSIGFNRFGNEVGPTNGPYYPVYLAGFYLNKRVSAINRLHVGVEGYYNSGYRQYLESQNPPELEANFIHASVLMVMVGNEFLIGRMGLVTQLGYNLHNPFLKYYAEQNEEVSTLKVYMPARFGVKYYLWDAFGTKNSNAYIGMFVKSNVGQADFTEFSLGYRF